MIWITGETYIYFFFPYGVIFRGSSVFISRCPLHLSVTPTTCTSSFTTSINLFSGLPLLLPGSSILLQHPHIPPLYMFNSSQSHLSLYVSEHSYFCRIPVIYSFIILSVRVNPNEKNQYFQLSYLLFFLFLCYYNTFSLDSCT